MKRSLFNCILFLLVGIASCKNDKSIETISCSISQLDQCLLKQSPTILRAVKNGIPSLGVPTLNPYHVDLIEVPVSDDIEVDLTDVDIHGVPDAEVQDLRIKFHKRRGLFKVHFKKIKVTGRFRINGFFIMDFDNITGTLTAVLEDVEVKLDAKFRINKKKVELSDAKLDIRFNGFEIQAQSDDEDQDAKIRLLKDFTNKNWRMIYRTYKEFANEMLEDIVIPVLTQVGNALLAKLVRITRHKSRDF